VRLERVLAAEPFREVSLERLAHRSIAVDDEEGRTCRRRRAHRRDPRRVRPPNRTALRYESAA
jgi:hypothetical protein